MRSTQRRAANIDALRTLAAPHLVAMGRLASRLTSAAERDRVVHASLAVAARELPQVDKLSSPQAWLLGIVADRARRHRPRFRHSDVGLVDLPAEALDLDRWVDADAEIASLPWEPRLAVELFYVLGLTVAECAAVMQCDEHTVTATLTTARERLIDGVEEIELS